MSSRFSDQNPGRLVPEWRFPSGSYVPGRSSHYTRGVESHASGPAEPIKKPLQPARWREFRPYLWGIDLFNYGYYWEAHEAWEGVWHAVGRRGPVADFLKGLIVLAAAGVKARQARPAGLRRHALRAQELFSLLQNGTFGSDHSFMGLKLGDLAGYARELAADPERFVNSGSQPVVVVMTFTLTPC